MATDESRNDRTESFVALIAGLRISHYKISNKIGAGGMGEVYLAEDTRLNRRVALKFLPRHLSTDQSARARFVREAQAAAGLKHPNIVTVYEVSEYEGRPFLAMEYIEGKSLYDLIKKREINTEEAVDIAVQMCDGLDEAHRSGIVHRDVKPSNILVDEKGRAQLVDFGLAAVEGSDKITRTGSTMGTAAYMSPEQARGKKTDRRSDIFSLGVVLYEMITGRRLFKGEDVAATLHAIAFDTPEPLARYKADVPDELQRIIDKALEKDSRERYQHADDLRVDLKRLMREADASGLSKPSPRVRRRLIIYPLVVIVAAIVVFVWWMDRSEWFASVPSEKHLAVLPFASPGDVMSAGALCDGLVETLSSKLTQMQQFHGTLLVVPTSEVRQQEVSSASQAHRAFGVNLAVSGSIQQLGEDVRLTLNLVDARSERQLRSSVIDYPLDNLAGLQDSSVRIITDMLEVHLRPEDEAILHAGETDVPKAYDLYLRGQGYLQCYERLGAMDTAIELFQMALNRDPDYVLALAGLGAAYWRKYSLDTDPQWAELAVYNSRRALEINDEMAPVHVSLGLIYRGTGRYEEAVRQYNRALSFDSTDGAALLGLAMTLEASGMLDTAEAVYKRAVAIGRDKVSAHTNLGVFYAVHDRYDEGLEQLDFALAEGPRGYQAWNNLGGLCYHVGAIERAMEMWEQSITIDPNYPALQNLGAFHFGMGNYTEAALRYREALDLNDSDYRTWINYASVMSNIPGENEQEREAWSRAIELGETQRRINPRDYGLMTHLADAYASIGDLGRAVALIEEVLDMNPEEAEIIVRAGYVFELSGDRDRALALIVEALSRGYSRDRVESVPELSGVINDPRFDSLTLTSPDTAGN